MSIADRAWEITAAKKLSSPEINSDGSRPRRARPAASAVPMYNRKPTTKPPQPQKEGIHR